MIFLKRVLRVGLVALIISIVFIIIANVWVITSTQSKVFNDYTQLPGNSIALVLGTSHRLSSGGPNPFFENRITTAANLYREGKVVHFILSGDNRTRYYNEPMMMKRALMRQGVPDSVITLDYAGLRTLDSIVRCKEIFGQEKIIIITQTFHSYRALFISDYYKMDAIVLAANDSTNEFVAKVNVREYLARTKAILDLYFLSTAPRHMGEKEPITL
jgi:SanA protein